MSFHPSPLLCIVMLHQCHAFDRPGHPGSRSFRHPHRSHQGTVEPFIVARVDGHQLEPGRPSPRTFMVAAAGMSTRGMRRRSSAPSHAGTWTVAVARAGSPRGAVVGMHQGRPYSIRRRWSRAHADGAVSRVSRAGHRTGRILETAPTRAGIGSPKRRGFGTDAGRAAGLMVGISRGGGRLQSAAAPVGSIGNHR